MWTQSGDRKLVLRTDRFHVSGDVEKESFGRRVERERKVFIIKGGTGGC